MAERVNEEVTCSDCQLELPLKVQCSRAGFYIGRFCENCGPYSRESGYFTTHDEARRALRSGNYERRTHA
jgi:hypothetical protein